MSSHAPEQSGQKIALDELRWTLQTKSQTLRTLVHSCSRDLQRYEQKLAGFGKMPTGKNDPPSNFSPEVISNIFSQMGDIVRLAGETQAVQEIVSKLTVSTSVRQSQGGNN